MEAVGQKWMWNWYRKWMNVDSTEHRWTKILEYCYLSQKIVFCQDTGPSPVFDHCLFSAQSSCQIIGMSLCNIYELKEHNLVYACLDILMLSYCNMLSLLDLASSFYCNRRDKKYSTTFDWCQTFTFHMYNIILSP